MTRFIVPIAITALLAGLAVDTAAQHLPQVVQPVTFPPTAPADTTGHAYTGRFLLRGLAGIGSGGIGMLAGGVAANFLAGEPRGEFGNLGEVILGMVIGWTIGAGYGAALPVLGSPCTRGQRVGRGIGWAVLGTTAGLLLLAVPGQSADFPAAGAILAAPMLGSAGVMACG